MAKEGDELRSVAPFGPRAEDDWMRVESRMRILRLDSWVLASVPLLTLASLSRSTRGFTLYPGKAGLAIGAAVMAGSVAIAYLLYAPLGVLGAVLAAWLLGSSGGATVVASLMPTAFVKPICVRCRLLPVIKEHEAIHLAGVASEKAVWDSMKSRHSVASLSLEGDPSICSFCPIPKRLSEH